jgi:tRNA-dependent cyclodipeptide synthase
MSHHNNLAHEWITGSGAIDFGTHRYKASLQKIAPAHFDLASSRRCMLGISLGTHTMEGARLEACLEWLSANFDECAVVIGDLVYRLTLELLESLPGDQALAKALAAGKEFERVYAPLFRQYAHACKFEFLPLSSIAEDTSFPVHLQSLWRVYDHDPQFRASVEGFAHAYLGRGSKLDDEQPIAGTDALICRRYLLEEAALFACLRERGWPSLVYPGSIDSIVGLCEGRYAGAPEPLTRLAFVALEVKRKGLFFADGASKVIRAGASTALEGPSASGEFLAELSDSDWAQLLKHTKLKKYGAREPIVKAGESDKNLLLLIDGRADVSVSRPDGTRQQLAFLDAGTVFGEQSFLDGLPRSATVTAVVECELRSLARKDLEALIEKHPRIACAVLADLGRVLSMRSRRMLFEMQHLP